MDRWEDGDGYDPYIGRWSRRVASEFVDWLGVGTDAGWRDVGCGTGALLGEILKRTEPASVAGIDPSASFLAAAWRNTERQVDLRVGHAEDIPFASGSFDVVVSGLALNFVPDVTAALEEMRRVAAGGQVAIYLWDYAEGMELIRYFWDAAVEFDPGSAVLDEVVRFPLCAPDAMVHLFKESGFGHVEARAIDAPTVFAGFDDYWNPFLLAQRPAPGYVASLDPGDRLRLRCRISQSSSLSGDGPIHLTARAWAVSGMAP